MSGATTTVDGTEAEDEAGDRERNRVAWNLPREVTPAPSSPTDDAVEEAGPALDAVTAAEDG